MGRHLSAGRREKNCDETESTISSLRVGVIDLEQRFQSIAQVDRRAIFELKDPSSKTVAALVQQLELAHED